MWRFFLLVVGLVGCVNVGVERVQVDLELQGTEFSGAVEGRNGAQVTVTRAEVAFGPLYLCAGAQAGELCKSSLLEWRNSHVVDALSDRVVEAGRLVGRTGTARSWMFDFGITSLLTQKDALLSDAAKSLGGVSAVLEGTAEVAGVTVPFSAEVRVEQSASAEQGLPVVRKSTNDVFEHDVKDRDRLQVQFNASAWLTQVDFESLLQDGTCTAGGATLLCDEQLELTCVGGVVDSQRDCTALGLFCQRDVGCVDQVGFGEGSQGYAAVRSAMEAGTRPDFVWNP